MNDVEAASYAAGFKAGSNNERIPSGAGPRWIEGHKCGSMRRERLLAKRMARTAAVLASIPDVHKPRKTPTRPGVVTVEIREFCRRKNSIEIKQTSRSQVKCLPISSVTIISTRMRGTEKWHIAEMPAWLAESKGLV